MSFIHSTLDFLRDRYAPVTHQTSFRATGQVTPEEFVQAGDFLVYKFPSWSWSSAADPSKRVSYLPENKQYLVTRGVPCRRRLDQFESAIGGDTTVERDATGGEDGEEGWLRTGGDQEKEDRDRAKDVRTLDGAGNIREKDEGEDDEDEIPDMEDEEDDEAIIRDTHSGSKGSMRTYNLYITYTPYYRTPRLYLSGYAATSAPLPPAAMMDDILGDYKDKTVTLEEFPFDASNSVKMASVHPCKHASVMKVLLDRANAALKLRKEKGDSKVGVGMEGLVSETEAMSLADKAGHKAGVAAAASANPEEWEVLSEGGTEEDDSAIRVDQYLVVFLKFMASVTPTIEHDFTMGV